MIRTGPLPEKPRNIDEATDRGWDTDSILHDRMPVVTDPELMAALRRQAADVRGMRDDDHEWRRSA